MAALCTSVISLWLCTPAATSSPGLWCLPWMCLQPEPGAHGGAPDQRERSLLVRRPSRADAQDEATQGRGSKSRLLCTSTQGRLPSSARILLHTHTRTHTQAVVGVGHGLSLLWSQAAVPRTSCRHCPRELCGGHMGTNSQSQQALCTFAPVCGKKSPHVVCLFVCFSSADLSRWIKCSPTGLKSQI